MHLFVQEKQFYKAVGAIALPIILQSLITAGVNMMDTLMLTACGEIPLSASSLANQYISLFQIMCLGLGFGACVLTSRFWGNQDISGFKKVTTLMLRVCVVFALAFSIATYCFPESVMRIYSPEESIILQGAKYLKISAFSLLFQGLSLTITAILRSLRQVTIALYTSIAIFFINVFFNWIFIFGKLGAPRMEIAGAALGTLIARIVECAVIGGYFLFVDQKIGYRVKDIFCSCKGYLRDYIRYCLPVLVSDTLLGLGNNMVSAIMGHIGQSFVAAFAVISQMTRMTNTMTAGLSNSASVITGNTLGAGDKERAYRGGITFVVLAACVGVLACLIVAVVCPVIIAFSNLSPETDAIARQLVCAVSITVIAGSIQSVLTKGVLRGAGDTRFLMAADILFLWLVSVPLGYLAGLVWKWPAFAVYLCLYADWFIKSAWCFIRLLKGGWVNNAVRN